MCHSASQRGIHWPTSDCIISSTLFERPNSDVNSVPIARLSADFELLSRSLSSLRASANGSGKDSLSGGVAGFVVTGAPSVQFEAQTSTR
jgi:hypothetical protein